LTALVDERAPGAVTIGEESTAWPGVTRPVSVGGLGFSFKWNMGWMHDTLRYFGRDPVHRRWQQDELSFAMLYERDECFVSPLSHDEVVHGKGSLLAKLPGDERERLANLRALLLYQWTRPGKPLAFMGAELGSTSEWDFAASLDWHLAELPSRRGLRRFCEDLGRLHAEHPCFWRWDHDASGFSWISCDDAENSIYAYLRHDGDAHAVVVLNLAGGHRDGYRIGVPSRGAYAERMSSDAGIYGGWNHPTRALPVTEPVPFHGFEQSVELSLPPLAGVVLTPFRP
jgi:1,4-alpha-glucan branching enzyme